MSEACNWVEDEEGTWETECGEAFVFIEGGPTENLMRYCCYCGLPIVVQKYVEAGDDEDEGEEP